MCIEIYLPSNKATIYKINGNYETINTNKQKQPCGRNVIIILPIFSTLLQIIPLETPNLHHFGCLSILTIVFLSCNYYLTTISRKKNEKKL
jgi:hypothetical protein